MIGPVAPSDRPRVIRQLHRLEHGSVLDLCEVIDDFRAARIGGAHGNRVRCVQRDAAHVVQPDRIAEHQVPLFDAKDSDLVMLHAESLGQLMPDLFGIGRVEPLLTGLFFCWNVQQVGK